MTCRRATYCADVHLVNVPHAANYESIRSAQYKTGRKPRRVQGARSSNVLYIISNTVTVMSQCLLPLT